MARSDEDRFRVKPAAPKSRGGPRSQRFVSQVLKQVSKTGATPSGKSFRKPPNTFGRGRVAASMAGQRLGLNARRVVVKSRFVVLRRASPNSVAVHLRYIERDGVTRDGQKGQAYGADTDVADIQAFQDRGQNDRHQFRFIVSAEDGVELQDLKGFTRQLMRRMEIDLETRLDWIAVDHWDTDNPHTHIVLNGHTGGPGGIRRDLVISPDYLAYGMRSRASEIATDCLGPRTEAEIRQSRWREVDQQRLTSLDRVLVGQTGPDGVSLTPRTQDAQRLNALQGRLQYLETLDLAERMDGNRWKLKAELISTLNAMGQRAEALETIRRSLKGQYREALVHDRMQHTVVGRIAGKGLADELNDRGYLVVDGLDGRAHYLALPLGTQLADLPVHGVVEVVPANRIKPTDREIVNLLRQGRYCTEDHMTKLRGLMDRDPQLTVDVHVRRLEALRRIGLVERVSEGLWKVPADLLNKVQQHGLETGVDLEIRVLSHLPIDRQVGAIGVTWLDRQLVGDPTARAGSEFGFGALVREALRDRGEFLSGHGLAEMRNQRVVVARNLLKALRELDLSVAARQMAEHTGQMYRSTPDGTRAQGIYRGSVQLTSGKFAVLDQGMEFRLVPWRPVLEGRIGQTVSAVPRGSSATWQLGRQRGLSM
jgi:type IV secretory pathway VirD2 relaxase